MSQTMVLAIDFVNDIVSIDSPHAKNGSAPEVARRGIIASTKKLLQQARSKGALVAHVRIGFSPDYRECPSTSQIFSAIKSRGALKLGTWGTEVHADLGAKPDDLDIVKHRVSAFYGTPLELLLRQNRITQVMLAGVSTTAAINSTARDAHDRDYECTIVEDCCSARTQEEHSKAIDLVSRFATVVTLDQLKFN